MIASSQIDLSRLAAPEVVETLSFEAIFAALVDDFLGRWDALRASRPDLPAIDTLDLDSDPLAIAFQAAAWRELQIRARFNDGAKAGLLAFAIGADLDHLGALHGVARLTGESDDAFRRRIQLAPEAYSGCGPEGAYVFHALSADVSVADATAVQVAPGSVLVTIMRAGASPAPTDTLVAKVVAALSAETVRPLTDTVAVGGPEVVTVPVNARLTLYPGPDGAVVRAAALAALRAFLDDNRRLGRDLRASALYARLHVDGVQSVALTGWPGDVTVGPTGLVVASPVSVTVVGRDE